MTRFYEMSFIFLDALNVYITYLYFSNNTLKNNNKYIHIQKIDVLSNYPSVNTEPSKVLFEMN